ncbi:putative hydroxypyruvate isomerase isoform X2 [Hydra vulgaris]|uniref:Putative hydroxypyruvate isomerase n=1 Tax=Hydra vulgaris TaxID=6087 RepID=A0ABM4C6G8_HYDVU
METSTVEKIKPLKFSASLSFLFPEVLGIPKRYAAAKASGFQGVECTTHIYDYALPELIAAQESTKLKQVQMNFFCGQNNGIAAVPKRNEEFKQCLELSIQYCNALKCKRLHIMAGKYPEGVEITEETKSTFTETFIENLTYASQRLESERIMILIEPLSNVENYFLTSTSQAVAILKKMNLPNVKLQLDLYHHQKTDGNAIQALIDYFPFIGHIQIAQFPDRNEPDSPGDINYPEVFRLLVHLGYTGWIGCEYIPKDPQTSYNWLQQYLFR